MPGDVKELTLTEEVVKMRMVELLSLKVYSFPLPYFFGHNTVFFILPKQFQKSRSVLYNGSRSLKLFKKG